MRQPHDLLLGTKSSAAAEDYTARVTQCLTQIRGVNRTDVLTLTARFGTLGEILQATEEELSSCPGLGPAKVKRLFDAFRSGFLGNASRKRAAPAAAAMAAAPAATAAAATTASGPGTSASANANEKRRRLAKNGDGRQRVSHKPQGETDFNVEAFL